MEITEMKIKKGFAAFIIMWGHEEVPLCEKHLARYMYQRAYAVSIPVRGDAILCRDCKK